MFHSKKSCVLARATIVALVTGIFTADLLTPLGLAVGVLYLIPLWLTALATPRGVASAMAGICSILLAIGYLYSPAGAPPWIAVTNRVLIACTLWIIAILSDLIQE
jgi:hypothetical protein